MRQVVLVEGETPAEYVDVYNETLAELSRFEIVREKDLSDTSTLVFYHIPDEVANTEPATHTECAADLRCADCPSYVWGKRCGVTGEPKKRRDPACDLAVEIRAGMVISEGEVQ